MSAIVAGRSHWLNSIHGCFAVLTPQNPTAALGAPLTEGVDIGTPRDLPDD